ncbi:hypothetical protein [Actinoplanes sp. NPDC026623]|uniref:hypothetical protein n=1 Tax=Actinoplanes sp. NPDC026623 TaxID=3155610 RepID=UPI0034030CB9
MVSVDINRADPAADECGQMREIERRVRSFERLVVPLQGIGDGGMAIVDQTDKGTEDPLARTYACSGNALVSVVMRVDGVITDEAYLTQRSPEPEPRSTTCSPTFAPDSAGYCGSAACGGKDRCQRPVR